jgi:hypothetical protein
MLILKMISYPLYLQCPCNMSINKTIVDDETGEPLALSASETILYSHSSTTLTLSAGSGFPHDSIHIEHPSGALFITTHRLVFVAAGGDTLSVNLDDLDVGGVEVAGGALRMVVGLVEFGGKRARVDVCLASGYDAEAARGAVMSRQPSTVKR